VGTARARVRWRQLGAVVLAAGALTPLFNLLTSEVSLGAAVQGLVDAVLITGLVGGYLLFVRDGALRPWFGRLAFAASLPVNSAVVLGLFLVGRAAGQVVTHLEPRRFLASFTDPHLAWALPFFVALAVGVQFVFQMNRLVGANVLGYFVAGVYHRPRAEERIFLFLDLEGSTRLAERLGSVRYFHLLRRVVDDLTEPVLAAGGEIYQYAGDEVVITWPMAAGLREARCVRCFFGIRRVLAGREAGYRGDFGALPRFRGGLHGGTVTAGELGDLRQQIVFVGDILNTAARLEEYAKREGLDLVASEALLERLALPPGLRAARCGEVALRGKQVPVVAYALAETPGVGLAAEPAASPGGRGGGPEAP
jgi:adenylate cyclase